MKLLSHNHLLCLNKDCKCNDPLIIEPKKVIQIESEAKLSFMTHILSMIDYNVLLIAASQIGIKDLPKQLPSKEIRENESFLRSMQKVLLDSNIVEGKLTCNKCKTSYMIKNGVVDMMHPLKASSNEESKDDNNDNNDNEEDNDQDVDMNAFLDEDEDDDDTKTNNNDPKNDDVTNQDMIDID
mmetsp:Transcript_52637/g.47251  ORF Transcript_52637/g.47251 Transcript_52637/m.47251 type:complete len:183 (+) Transcript_52637:50-598(+)